MSPESKQGREIMNAIRDILVRDWNPIGFAGVPPDEYDRYIGPVHRMLSDNLPESELVEFLFRAENEKMGVSPASRDHLREVVRKLLNLKLGR
jgi:hypothetical protein